MDAESAYLFRHAVLRDAAYQLQLPGDRARLHALALEIIETVADALDPFAAELAEHAKQAASLPFDRQDEFIGRELKYLRMAAGFAKRNFHNSEAAACWLRLLEHERLPPREKPEIWFEYASGMFNVGQFAVANSVCEKALIDPSIDLAPKFKCQIVELYAGVSRYQGNLDAALSRAQLALELARQCGHREFESKVLSGLAELKRISGDLPAAKSLFAQSIETARLSGGARNYAVAQATFGRFLADTGEFDGALQNYHIAEQRFVEIGDRRSIAVVRASRAMLLKDSGRVDEAFKIASEILKEARELGDSGLSQVMLGQIAQLEQEMGKPRDAVRTYQESAELARSSGNLVSEALTLNNMSNALKELREYDKAMEGYEAALALFHKMGDSDNQGLVLMCMGSLLVDLRREQEAEQSLRESVKLLAASGNRRLEAQAHCCLAFMCLQFGRLREVLPELEITFQLSRTLKSYAYYSALTLSHRYNLLLGNSSAAAAVLAEVPGRLETPYLRVRHIHYGRFQEAVAEFAPAHKPLQAVAPEIQTAMAALERDGALVNNVEVAETLQDARQVMAELADAACAKRCPALLRGFHPDALGPGLRRALLADMKERTPQLWDELARANAPLLEMLQKP